MNITKYHLIITNETKDHMHTTELIYLGNENITIQSTQTVNNHKIDIPRHILEKFMEMIE